MLVGRRDSWRRWMAGGLVLALCTAPLSADDDFIPPSKAEREAVTALIERGAAVTIDAQYRVASVMMPTNCSNDDLKPLAACRDLTQLQLTSDQITDAGVEHLKGLTQLKTIMLRSTAMSSEEINAWRAALPNCQIVTPTIRPANGFVGGPGGGPITTGRGARGSAPGTFGSTVTGPAGPGAFGMRPLAIRAMPLRILAAQSAIQDELKLTPEQRDQIARATDVNAFTQGMDDRVRAILSAEQQSRAKQLELQQLTADAALVRDDVVKALKLTDDQLAAVRKMAEETALKSRSAMSEAFSGPGVDRSTFGAKLAQLAKEGDEQILTVLSAEQREGWQALLGPSGPRLGSTADGTAGASSRSSPALLTSLSRTTFQRYDADGSGTLTEAELPQPIRSRMGQAGVTLKFPVSSEDFVKGYSEYLQRPRTGQ